MNTAAPYDTVGLPLGTRDSPRFDPAELTDCLSRRLTAARIAWLFVALGAVVRLTRYLLTFPLWADEYQLAANFLDRGFLDLLRPLDNNQVAPIGFLWIERCSILAFGFSELSLRLFPAACGIASLFLFRHVAARLMRGVPLAFAVAIFSVAYYPIRHAAEVKPYSSDLLVSLALLAMAVHWWQAPGRTRWLWLLTLAAPLALAVSFTAAFVAGGISLGIAWTFFQRRRSPGDWPARGAWLAFNLTVAAAFLGLMQLNIGAQYSTTRSAMTDCWADGFPPWRSPLALLLWLCDVHTGPMFAYPVGGQNGGSVLTLVCFLVGLVELFRGRRELAATVFGMFGLSLVAAALHRYPYGSHARLSQYLAPAICLLAGTGAASIVARIRFRPIEWRTTVVRFALAAGMVMGAGLLARDLLHPFKSKLDRDHRDFARSFWNAAPDAVTLCVQTDLGLHIYGPNFETGYRCLQRIYSPAHRDASAVPRGLPADSSRPLRCVLFHSASAGKNETAFAGWMEQMLARYDLVGIEHHEVPLSSERNDLFDFFLQCYDVYRFVPKPAVRSADPPARLAGVDPAKPG